MPAPSLITDLSQTAASNSPSGSEAPSVLDDVQRAHASFIALLRDGKGHTNAATIASAATCDIGSKDSLFVDITGVTGISSLGTNYNGPRFCRFNGALTLTNGVSLTLPGGANITTANGDWMIAIPNPSGTGWIVAFYMRAAGVPASSGNNSDITQLSGLTTAISGAALGNKIQPITASVASNALTLTLNPTTLDFRSATPSSGAVNTRSVSAAISVVVPSTATLGTASGSSLLHRLAVLAIDNAGTVELAVANISQGMWLDETELITTTTISASANSASVAYSTTGRSSVPFRIVGFVDIAEATAGTWASAPTVIQGVGGAALPFIPGKYVSQSLSGAAVDFTGIPSWVNSIDIVFTNATTGTGNPIVQIGTAAALVTSGYPSNTSVRSAATSTVLSGSSTSGFLMYTSAAADVLNMMMSLRRVAGNTWAMTAQGLGSGWAIISGGYLSLTGPLGQIRLINTSGNWGGGSASILMR